jgi:hypothetical protein
MEFNFKITTWARVLVDEQQEKFILRALKSKRISSIDDVYDYLAEKGDMNIECEMLFETDHQLTPKENKGDHTIEARDDNGEIVWTNIEKL